MHTNNNNKYYHYNNLGEAAGHLPVQRLLRHEAGEDRLLVPRT